MDPLLVFGLEMIRWLQDNYPQLEGFLQVVTLFGNEEFYLAVLPLIYWCLSKDLGKQLGYLFFVAVSVNTIGKQLFRGPRPFWVDPALSLTETGGYGIPSGHTQYATALYLLVAAWFSQPWIWLLAVLGIGTMSLSRIYLGQHFPHDSLGGLLLGLMLLAGVWVWRRYFEARVARRILGQKLLLAIIVPSLFAALYFLILLLIGPPDLEVPWAEFVALAELSSRTEMATAVGALLGFGIGIVMESSRVRFRHDGPVLQRIGRYVFGIVVTVIIWRGLGWLFPAEPLWLAIPLRIFRYALVTLWASYYAPLFFVRFRLASANPEPGISLKL